MKAITVSIMEEKKRKEKVKELNQLLSKIERSSTKDESAKLDQDKQPEIANKNDRFPTFR